MRVSRVGFTPVKGGRHQPRASVTLTDAGPEGDRAFALVDPERARCLRTVENPTLLATAATWDGTRLAVDLPSGRVDGEPVSTGRHLEVDYWGRSVRVAVVDGPWAAAYSAHLGRDVVLVRAAPGDVVYGASVTIVTSSSVERLAELVRAPVDGARFRATVELDTTGLPAWDEDGWVGHELVIGTARVRVRGPVPRCAVVDLDPASGTRDLAVLKALGPRPSTTGELAFGAEAEVTHPGTVRPGDPASLHE